MILPEWKINHGLILGSYIPVKLKRSRNFAEVRPAFKVEANRENKIYGAPLVVNKLIDTYNDPFFDINPMLPPPGKEINLNYCSTGFCLKNNFDKMNY